MDNTITPQKLMSDAEFYISKINEVHNQYSMQGQQKINTLEAQKSDQKNKLTAEINQATQQVNQLRSQLQALESDINQKRLKLTSIDSEYAPQDNSIRQKLLANDNAKQISIVKLTSVKEGIQKYIK
jgi:seryl-tRNA synthetase